MTMSSSLKRRLVGELTGIAAGTLGIALGLWYLVNLRCDVNAFFCENSAVLEYPSPARAKKFVLFFRDCGATTDFVTNGSILDADQALPDQSGNVIVAFGAHGPRAGGDAASDLSVTWVDDHEVRITHRKGLLVSEKRRDVAGVRISYAEVE